MCSGKTKLSDDDDDDEREKRKRDVGAFWELWWDTGRRGKNDECGNLAYGTRQAQSTKGEEATWILRPSTAIDFLIVTAAYFLGAAGSRLIVSKSVVKPVLESERSI